MTGTDQPTAEQTTATVRDAVTREAVLRALLDRIDKEYKAARTEVQDLLDEQQKKTGGTKFDALLPDGTKVGSASLSIGETAAQIVDDEAFTAWVRETYPSEAVVRIVKSVRAQFTARLLDEMTAAGAAQIVDPETGEMHDVPGVEIKPARKRTHSVNFLRKTKARPVDGRELVAAAWRSGALASIVLPALAPAADIEGDAA